MNFKKKSKSPIKKQSALKMFLSKTPQKKTESASSSASNLSARDPGQFLSSKKPPRIPNNQYPQITLNQSNRTAPS